MPTPLSPTLLKQRAEEMRDYLSKNIEPAKGVILSYEQVLSRLSALEMLINKLRKFIQFLVKLKPTEYLRWMSQAYSKYTKLETTSIPSPSSTSITQEQARSTLISGPVGSSKTNPLNHNR